MYNSYSSYQKRNSYNPYRKFSLSKVPIPLFASYPGYPSYLGVKVFEAEEKYLGKSLLGFTNGNFIVVKKGLAKVLRLFVQFHEEEHVKDMSATEKEVDKRAVKRLMLTKKTTGKELKEVKKVLRQRWQALDDFAECGLRNFALPEKKKAEPRKIYYFDWKIDFNF